MQSTFRFLVALTLILVSAFPVGVSADDSTSILISEILTGTSTGAGQEFVELYNPNPEAVVISGWSIEYKPATSSTWSKKSDLSGSIEGRSYYLVAPRSYIPDSDADWSSTLATSGGHVRIVDKAGRVIDLLGYGSANSPEGSAAVAPPNGQSVERLPGKLDPLAGNGQDTNDNSKDFLLRIDPEPQSSKSEHEPRVVGSEPDPIDTDDSESETEVKLSPTLLITELFIDPEFPLTDAEDEFIEIYNPNDVEVSLEGYVLKGGTNFRNSYMLPPGKLKPKEYAAYSSSQTGIPLTNTGGSVQLYDPSGRLIDQTLAYSNAKPGQSWALDGGVWAWSLLPTRGVANIVTPSAIIASALSPKKTVKPASAKSVKVKAPAKAKKAAAKSSKAKSTNESKKQKSEPIKVAAARIKPASWLIITLAIFTISYAIYEFRHDISNGYKKLRGNLRSWKVYRKSSKRRRND